MMDQTTISKEGDEKDGWVMTKLLGSGGFGAVCLWVNQELNQKVALKQCRVVSDMTEKMKSRWTLEVQIMGRLEHDNVVKAQEVPPPLEVRPNEMPLLAMEYCSGGDLRKVLNLPKNCCGLAEYQVRSIAADISAGIEYLHANRIIHRDLKPENIVLQEADEGIVYKLIDLGYAKDLDQGSVCTSFVGTLQYLAPELYDSNAYTCTVDYWSFGTLMFECICGVRPFLPNLLPAQWHKKVSGKASDDICATLDNDSQVKYSTKLPKPNQLCSLTQALFERWLKLMLRWDAKTRGGGHDPKTKKRTACFVKLDEILNYKMIKVLDVATNTLYTIAVTATNTLGDVQKSLEENTKIPVAQQQLLLASGLSPDSSHLATQCLSDQGDDWIVFLFKQNETIYQAPGKAGKQKQLPQNVAFMARDANLLLPYQTQKKAWGNAYSYCREQAREYNRLLQAQRAAMLQLLRLNTQAIQRKQEVNQARARLTAKMEFVGSSLELDIKHYVEQQETGHGITSERMYKSWGKMKDEIKSFSKLQKEVENTEMQITVQNQKVVELQRSPYARSKQKDNLDEMEMMALKLYEDLVSKPKEQRTTMTDNTRMVNILVRCLRQQETLTKDLYQHLSKVAVCRSEISRLIDPLENALVNLNAAIERLDICQQQRQKDIWRLVNVALNQVKKRGESSSSSPLENPAGDETAIAPLATPPTSLHIPPPQSHIIKPRSDPTLFDKSKEESMIIRDSNFETRNRLDELMTSLRQDGLTEVSSSQLQNWSFLENET